MKKLVLWLSLICVPVGAQILSAIFFQNAASPWINAHSITIDHTKVPNTDQTNYPLYIGGTYSWLAVAGSGGQVQHTTTCCANTETVPADLIFTTDSACTNKVAGWDIPYYVTTTGAIEAHVNVASVSHTVDTVIYACTNNPAVSTFQTTYTSAWNANYIGVWHFGDNTALDLHDSTTGGSNGTNNNVTLAAGKLVGGAVTLNGTNGWAQIGANVTALQPAQLTVQAWFKPNGAQAGFATYVNQGYSNPRGNPFYSYALSSGHTAGETDVALGHAGGSPAWVEAGTCSSGVWCLMAGTFDGTTEKGYKSGVYSGFSLTPGSISYTSTGQMRFGANDTGGELATGTLDEVRISNKDRGADWLLTESNNQSSPSTFYTVASVR